MNWAAIIGAVWAGIKWGWPVIRAGGIWLGVMTAHTVIVKTLWESAFSGIDGMVTGYSASTINFSPLALVNSLFPLSEGLTMLTAYCALVLTSNSVRMTKAFIDSKKT